MRLQYKLLLINLATAAVAALMLWLAYAGVRTIGDEYLTLGERTLPAVLAAEDIKAATIALEAAINRLALLSVPGLNGADITRERTMEMKNLRTATERLQAGIATYTGLIHRFSPDQPGRARRLEAAADVLLAVSNEVVVRLAQAPDGPELVMASDRLEPFAGVLADRVAQVLAQESQDLAGRKVGVADAITASGRLVAAAGAVTLLLMATAGCLVARTIAAPIGRLTEATTRIAAGEFVLIEPPRSKDEIGRLVTAFRKMTEDLASSQARAQHLALHDALTGLPNRVLLAERLTQALAQARRHDSALAVLCLDLDRFKEVNDTLGHAAGDLLLQQAAERLRGCVRETDTVARLGGDEFAIVQDGAEQPADAAVLCRRILDALRAPFLLDGREAVVGVSIGVALAPTDGVELESLLGHADMALYRAKEQGRGAFRFFEEAMNRQLQARRALERDLRQAIAERQFELRYQPQVELRTGRIVGAEALIRWRHPERREILPDAFVPLAEETGLIIPIGEWALGQACAQAAAWPGLKMAVNLSPVQFRQADLAVMVERVLSETGLDPDRLELEITEGVLLEDTEAALATLRALKGLGVRIAMDDFGTGYSSLSYLRRFPFDKIKIDRSFVADLGRSAEAAAIVRSLVGLGCSLGITINAEGVEGPAQAEFLRAEGCEEVQGYHFGRPIPATDFERLLGSEIPPAPVSALTVCPA